METIKYNVTIYDFPEELSYSYVTDVYYEDRVLNFTDSTGKEVVIRTDKWIAKEV